MSRLVDIERRSAEPLVASARPPLVNKPTEDLLRILVVDHSDADQAAICRMLSAEANFEVHAASSVDGLMTTLADREIDCVTLDAVVGTEKATAIIEQIKTVRLYPPAVIMLTGAGNERTAVNAFRCGFSDYVRKESAPSSELPARIVQAVAAKREQNRQKEDITRLSSLVGRDSLTGLANRHSLEERLSILLESGKRYAKIFAIIMLDLNEFKKINDNLGHSVGDHALKAFASQLSKTARRSDTYGRFGGDEFLYVIENAVTIESITLACRRLLDSLSFSLELQNVGLSLRPSIGAAIYPIDGRTIAELLQMADQAMYEAKTSGGGYCLACERKPSSRAAPGIGAGATTDVKQPPSSAASSEASASDGDAAADSPTIADEFPSAPTERQVERPRIASAPVDDGGAWAAGKVHRYADRRIEPRKRVFKRGIIVTNNGYSTIDCVIRDLSTHGARITLSAAVDAVPSRFSLVFAQTGGKVSAEKRWQNGQDIGLKFLDSVAVHASMEVKTPEDSPMPTIAEQPVSPAPVARRAFVVDDEPLVTAFVSRALVSCGFIASEFTKITEVEAALSIVRPELIVLDLSLGETDGVEIMQSIARKRFAGKILLISGHDLATLEEVRKIGERHGLAMLPVLHKPFRLQEFKARLDELSSSAAVSTAGSLLEVALKNNWLELWYQPKVNLKSMLIDGAEALVRIRHPERGVLPPSAFLPPPGSQLYHPLSDFVVRRALADWSAMAAAQSAKGGEVRHRFAVNIPASVLRTREFIDNVIRRLPKHPQFPGLMVEITEEEVIHDPELAREIAVQLRLHNILVSMDDFGAGHSTLERLTQIPFAEIKLDRIVVDGCSVDKRKNALCREMVDLAHRGNMIAVAEGMETADDLEAVIGMGFDVGQGFILAKPMEWEAVVESLASSQPMGGSELRSRAAQLDAAMGPVRA